MRSNSIGGKEYYHRLFEMKILHAKKILNRFFFYFPVCFTMNRIVDYRLKLKMKIQHFKITFSMTLYKKHRKKKKKIYIFSI